MTTGVFVESKDGHEWGYWDLASNNELLQSCNKCKRTRDGSKSHESPCPGESQTIATMLARARGSKTPKAAKKVKPKEWQPPNKLPAVVNKKKATKKKKRA